MNPINRFTFWQNTPMSGNSTSQQTNTDHSWRPEPAQTEYRATKSDSRFIYGPWKRLTLSRS